MKTEDFAWYERLCREFDRLETEFQLFAHEKLGLYFGLFESGFLDDQEVSDEGWQAFHTSAVGKVGKGGWEQWEHDSNGFCGCFFGNADLLPMFRKLAKSGVLILSEIEREVSGGKLAPCGYSLGMPKNQSYADWISFLFQTANLSTAWVRFDDYRYWDSPSSQVWDDLEADEVWAINSNGVRFPRHPLYRTLHMDLFFSSAEAIRLWRYRSEVVPLDGLLDDDVICLPDPEYDNEDIPASDDLPDLLPPTQIVNEVSDQPVWDGRTLRRGNEEFKKYPLRAKKIIPLLTAFQVAGWPQVLADPFNIKKREEELASKKRPEDEVGSKRFPLISDEIEGLKKQRTETMRTLNATQCQIRFEGVGDGYGVSWEWCHEIKPDCPSDAAKPPNSGE